MMTAVLAGWPRGSRWVDAALWLLALFVCLVVIVPFSPDMPLGGLDGSWRFALEQGMANGLVLGRDLVFTFGPYSSVYTRSYHPATHTLMMFASLYLALSFTWTLGLFIGACRRAWLAGLLLMMVGMVYFNDTILFMLPLLVGLQVFLRWQRSDSNQAGAPWMLVLLFAPLGLLPLVKGTLLVLCAMVTVLSAGFLWAQRRRALGAVCLLTPAVALVLLWCASGQPLAALPDFVAGMMAIVSGYNDAMSYYGVLRESLPFVVAMLTMLWAIARLQALEQRAKVFLFLLYGGVLFITFKAGFVRQDVHAMIASTTLLMAAIALNMVLADRRVLVATAVVMLPWLVIDHNYANTTPAKVVHTVGRQVAAAWDGTLQRLRQPDWPRPQFDAAVAGLRAQAALPVLTGRSDIYSYNQSWLIASGNQWAPRPVPQSYSAYTPALAERNRQFLLGAEAPRNIFFRVETVDSRLPSLDDGPSWPVLLANYRPAGMQNGMLILKQRDAGHYKAPATLPASTHRFGDVVPVPAAAAWFVQFDIKPTLLGRVLALVFRTSQLRLHVTTADGEQQDYRLIGGMARAGFVLSPLVENTADFAALYDNAARLHERRVLSVRLSTARGFQWLWQDNYQIALTPVAAIQ
jgi:hypothetical protein